MVPLPAALWERGERFTGTSAGYVGYVSVQAVGAISGVGGTGALYASSPYLNGVTRLSDAATAELAAARITPANPVPRIPNTTPVVPAPAAVVPATVSTAPSFANPAIDAIAQRAAIDGSAAPATTLASAAAGPPAAPPVTLATIAAKNASNSTFANPAIDDIAQQNAIQRAAINNSRAFVLNGDSGQLIQAYGAVALLTGPVAAITLLGLPPQPAITPVAPVVASPRLPKVEAFA